MGGNESRISINGQDVEMLKNEHNNYRGLHVVIINKLAYRVELAAVFDTYKTSKLLDNLIDGGIPHGYIVIISCQDECASSMSLTIKNWFCDLGSNEIWSLAYRQGFAFIGIQGKS